MKHITILAVLALFLLGACGPQNIRYSEKIKGNEIRAALYVKPVPEPINDINVWGRYSLGPDDNVTPAGKEERKIKQLFAASGFRNILLNNIRASERDLKGIMSLEITDNGFENADHASIAQAMTGPHRPRRIQLREKQVLMPLSPGRIRGPMGLQLQ